MSTDIATSIALPAIPQRNTATRVDIRAKDGKRKTISRKCKAALDAMIWEGLPFNEAAQKHGFDVASMRKALERPHVMKYLREQKQVFRASVSARNIHVLAEIRDQAGNGMARIAAVKVLEQVDEDTERKSAARTPGVVIQIINQGPTEPKILQSLNVLPNERSERDEDQ